MNKGNVWKFMHSSTLSLWFIIRYFIKKTIFFSCSIVIHNLFNLTQWHRFLLYFLVLISWNIWGNKMAFLKARPKKRIGKPEDLKWSCNPGVFLILSQLPTSKPIDGNSWSGTRNEKRSAWVLILKVRVIIFLWTGFQVRENSRNKSKCLKQLLPTALICRITLM